MTLREQFIKALEKRGECKIHGHARASRSIIFTRAEGGFYYLGKAGSLRVGRTKAASIPVSDQFRQSLLEELLP